ncbi:hypothetical protein BsWGS_06330 [Bradybaena similaris]
MEKQAELGFKTGGDNYDANRPSYTDESVDLIVSEIVSSSEAAKASYLKYDVLELGSGTGKLTEHLCKKLPSHMMYMATEPSENFLSILKSKGLNVDSAIATAGSIPLSENSIGSIVCAQCFHFFPEKKYLECIHRVLVHGVKLILIWNMKQFDGGWMSTFFKQRKEIINKIGGSTKKWVNSMEWRKDLDVSDDFKLLWHKSLPGIDFQGDIETIISNLMTSSAYKVLSASEQNAYVDELHQGLKNWPGLDLNSITMPYKTELFVYTAE